jgi:hypothetical protein
MAGATHDRALVCKVLPYMVLLGNQRRRRKNAEKMPLLLPFSFVQKCKFALTLINSTTYRFILVLDKTFV